MTDSHNRWHGLPHGKGKKSGNKGRGPRGYGVRGYEGTRVPVVVCTLTLKGTNYALTLFGLSLELQLPSVMMM